MSLLNILMIGKYPPIEGGESAKLYWLAKGLGERGHKVTIVSNCQEVEEEYRIDIPCEELKALQPKNVKLYSTSPFLDPFFVPKYNPYSEKLTSLALEAIQLEKPDIIVGWYLLPYAIAAYNVSKITKIPYIIQHAGSDLSRLFPNPYLNKFLIEIIKNSSGILTYPSHKKLFEYLGCKNIYIHKIALSPEFSPYGPKFDFTKWGLKGSIKKILFLGKISKEKGVDFLIEAFAKSKKPKALLFVGCGKNKCFYEEKIKEKKIQNVYFINSQPPWTIPNIIRGVDAVVVPEYNFGVLTHKSRIPLETVACGTPLYLSSYIAEKYPELENCYIKINPTNIKEFAVRLDMIVEEELRRDLIAKSEKIRTENNFSQYLENLEKIFEEILLGYK